MKEEKEFSTLDELVDHVIASMSDKNKQFMNNCSKAERYEWLKSDFDYPEVERIDHKRGERIFTSNSHHGYGTGLRNNLNLWWTADLAKQYPSWPQERPKLIEWFDSVGLDGSFGCSGDDRSGLILRAIYRKFHNLDIDIPGYVQYLKDFYGKQR